MNAGEINFFAGQSGSEMSATGFETGANSLPAIVNPPSPMSVISGSVTFRFSPFVLCHLDRNNSSNPFSLSTGLK